MKIHNYGNDYAYQQKQKSKKNEKAKEVAEVITSKEEIQKEEVTNAGNQISNGGERTVERPEETEADRLENEAGVEESRQVEETEERPATTSKRKKQAQ